MIYSDSLRSETNPKALAQGVALTAAASGSSGITVADNDNIDFGTGNFTLVWKGSLPDWTPAEDAYLITKNNSFGTDEGYQIKVNTDGKIVLTFDDTGFGNAILSSVANSLINNTVAEIVAVMIRGVSTSTIDFYINGILLGTQQSCANVGSVSSTGILYINGLGYQAIRTAGTCIHALTYNRALTAAEVLDLYRNGVALKHFDPTGVSPASQTAQTSGTLVVGKEYTIDDWITNDDFTNVGGANVDGTIFVATGTTPTTWTNSSSLRRTGATLWLASESWQSNKPYDCSGNNLTCAYPASGWSLTRRQLMIDDEAVAMSSKAPKASPSFTVGIGIGGVAAGTGGIAFPATQVAVADVNTLDDYEEGYFTGSLDPQTSGSITVDAAYDQLQYTKIGRKVTISGKLTVGSVSSPVGYMRCGLPFVASALTEDADIIGVPIVASLVTSAQNYIALIVPGTQYIGIYAWSSTGGESATNCANYFQAGTQVYVHMTYIV